ncbi:hypothetical protein ACOME3_006893 [Neoechinorhynchus agilis]
MDINICKMSCEGLIDPYTMEILIRFREYVFNPINPLKSNFEALSFLVHILAVRLGFRAIGQQSENDPYSLPQHWNNLAAEHEFRLIALRYKYPDDKKNIRVAILLNTLSRTTIKVSAVFWKLPKTCFPNVKECLIELMGDNKIDGCPNVLFENLALGGLRIICEKIVNNVLSPITQSICEINGTNHRLKEGNFYSDYRRKNFLNKSQVRESTNYYYDR